MRLGKTSVVHFFSSLVASGAGFLATIYIARMLGAEPLGVYNLVVGLVSWLAIAGRVGISKAIIKRVSEGTEPGAYTMAGVSIIAALFLVLAAGIVLFRSQVVNYVGYPATGFIVLILLAVLLNGLINALLMGFHLVHVSGILSPIRTGGRAIAQIALVAVGASTMGLLLGHIIGFGIAIVIGAYYVFRNIPELSRPEQQHFESLANFAKFSWLGSLQSNMFSYTDVLILGVFVSSGLIGVYAVAWNIAEFLILFSSTLQSTLFPEMSAISAEEDPQAVARIVEQSLSFGGLFLIPGLFGGALLGERILRLYGPEFPKGSTILTLLIVANLFMGYQNQLLNALNAIDRPDLAFRVNIVFVGANIVLNLVLIYLYGWVGAAVATTASVVISLVFAYQNVNAIIDFDMPTGEIGRQWFAAVIMALLVYGGLYVEKTHRLLGHNAIVLFVLVIAGAGMYFLTLLGISTEFRETVDQNLPVFLPFVSR